MNLVSTWNPAFINQLVKNVQGILQDEVYVDFNEYVSDEDGLVNLNEETEVESALEQALDEMELSGLIGTSDFDSLYEAVFNEIPQSFFDNIVSDFKEEIHEILEYKRNPMRYVGMSVRDFI